MSDPFDRADFIDGFIAEAEEHLGLANANLLSVEAAANDQATPRQVRELFRSLHTIKGLAAMVSVDPIVDIAHAMESVLREADRAAGRLPRGAIEPLLSGTRAIEARIRALAKGQPVAAAPAQLVDTLNNLRQEPAAPGTPAIETSLASELWTKLGPAERVQLVQGLSANKQAFVLRFVPTPALSSTGVSITSVRERAAAVAEVIKVVPQSLPVTDASPGGLAFALVLVTDRDQGRLAEAVGVGADALSAVTLITPVPPVADVDDEIPADDIHYRGVVRVEVARLDEALERLSALVVTQFRLTRTVAALRSAGADIRALSQVVTENGRQLRDLRGSIMRARMVSVSELLERIPLLVRGLSRSIGKEVSLSVVAGKAELDKGVAERIFPAIVHLVRNAVDHAFEMPDERRAAGKPAAGRLSVSCQERSDNQLELTISDDGRGVDRAAVARRAGVGTAATDDVLLDLLTRPGLSTKSEVTRTSGRGIGMDVVRRIVVDDLRGDLSMTTTAGQGSTFRVRIPLSITIVDAFSFMCGSETFVVPVSMIEEIQDLNLAQTVRGPDRRRISRGEPDRRRAPRATEMMQRRGEAVPVLRLDELLGLTSAAGDLRRKAMIVRRGGAPFAFAVDRMLGQQEVVVRPLEDKLVQVQGLSGTTDLGDGRPTLVLDLVALGAQLLADGRGAAAS